MGDHLESQEKAAECVLEHVTLQWEDQVGLAENLVERRKALSSMLAIVVGLGVFRIQFTAKADEVATLTGPVMDVVRHLLISGLCCFLIGAYFLYSTRPVVRRFLYFILDKCCNWFSYLWRLARQRVDEPTPEMSTDISDRWPRDRAVSLMMPDDENVDDWLELTKLEVLQSRCQRVREAYLSLCSQNKRVAGRLKFALTCIFLGYFLVFAALGSYIYCVRPLP